MSKILHVDSRRIKYHKQFGDITTAPAERLFTYTDIIEPVGAVTCVAIAGAKACGSQTGKTYDYMDSFDNAPHTINGMYPSDWFGSVIKRGLKVFGSTDYDTIWKSYWDCHSDGNGDAFDNTINASNHANSAVTVWTNWYLNWDTLLPLEVMPQGVGTPSYHDWVIKGWQMVNGVQMMVVDADLGQVNLMPREVFNLEVAKLGCGTGIPATAVIQTVERRSLIQWLIDCYQNLILLLRSEQSGTLPPTSTELAWDTQGNCSHSVRVMCDQAGLTLQDKNIIWACIRQESDFLPTAIGKYNLNGTRDWGICQFNDGKNAHGIPLWIGDGAIFPNTQYVLDNPQACVAEMIAQYKLGHINWWASYKTGAYLKWLPYIPIE